MKYEKICSRDVKEIKFLYDTSEVTSIKEKDFQTMTIKSGFLGLNKEIVPAHAGYWDENLFSEVVFVRIRDNIYGIRKVHRNTAFHTNSMIVERMPDGKLFEVPKIEIVYSDYTTWTYTYSQHNKEEIEMYERNVQRLRNILEGKKSEVWIEIL